MTFVKNIFAILIFLFLTVPAVSLSHGGEHVFVMTDDGYTPTDMTIELGETIVFKNSGSDDRWPASNIHPTHAIYSEFDAMKPVLPGESWSFTFEKEGTWRWHDHLTPSMNGEIVVSSGEVSNGAEEEKKGFFKKIFGGIGSAIKSVGRWFAGLFGDDEPEFAWDETIEESSSAIFQDMDALKSYVKKFGPGRTIERLNELSAEFGSCHNPAHEAGRFSYEIFEDKAFQKCSAYCHSGCYHGATEAYFKEHGTANFAENLKVLCTSELNSFFSHQCIHGIGHGLMAWTDYDLPEALKSCDLLSEQQSSCWSGVFMENIVGGLAEKEGQQSGETNTSELAPHFTKYLSDDPLYPCPAVDDKYENTCYFLQTSRMAQLYGSDYAKISKGCSDAPVEHQRSCFESMGRDVNAGRRDPETSISACSHAPLGSARTGCLIGAVQDTFWDPTGQDTALSFCALLKDKGEKEACYQTIFGRAPDVIVAKSDLQAFCGKAETAYRALCLARVPAN